MKLYVVNHTHWDREWYRPHEAFRARLLELVETVCGALDAGRMRHFHLDGQTVTVTDVADVRPDLADRIAGHVAAGRMSIGPWHVLADNQLVSGENLIRNLLAARRHAGRFGLSGTGLSRIGYCPDAFGHPADLPRVLRGFGIDTALVWRGAPPRYARFRWRSPDGSEVLAVNQRYYEPEVLWDAAAAPERLAGYLQRQAARDPEGPWLLLNGADHLAPRALAGRLAVHPSGGTDARPALADDAVEVVECGLAEALADLTTSEHPVVDRELRYPGDWLTFLLPGTLSARMYLKQANAEAQTLLERWAEPFTVLSGQPANSVALLRHAWDLLLANAPHDSICGCSVDEVHRENEVRYARVVQVGEHLLHRALRDLGLDTRVAGPLPAEVVEVAVLNPHPWPVTGGVEVDVFTAPGRHVTRLVDPSGEPVDFDVVGRGTEPVFCADVDLPPDTHDGERHRVGFVARDVPPTGWARFRLLLGAASAERHLPRESPGRTVERDGWTLTVADDVSLSLADSRTGRVLSGLGRLVDGGDAGDSYTYDPPAADRVVTPSLRHARVSTTPVRSVLGVDAVLHLPVGLTGDRSGRSAETREIPVTVTATLWGGVPELVWRVEFDNPVDDHRLRVHFAGDGPADTWLSDGHFSLVHRPLTGPHGPLPTERGYEADAGVAPVQSWAAVPGVAVFAPGLPEVAGLRREGRPPELAVTLLRSVGWLSRPDLRARTAGAGPQLATPEAQCRRTVRATIGIRPGDHSSAELVRAAALRRAPLRAYQLRPVDVGRPPAAAAEVGSSPAAAADSRPGHAAARAEVRPLGALVGHLSVEGAQVSALKPAEDGDGAVLRLVNQTPDAVRAGLTGLNGPLVECDFAERPTGQAYEAGEALELGPYATRSFRIGRAPGRAVPATSPG